MNSPVERISNSITKCRVCRNPFFAKPLLRYKNMPKAAQFLPDAQSVVGDEGVDLVVCQCTGCGLVQLNNPPVPYYKEVVRAAAFSQEMRAFRLKQFEALAEQYSLKGKKVIEIGCGRGEYLSLIRQSGMDAYGLEYSEESVSHCCDTKLKVAQGFVDRSDFMLANAPFSAFFMLSFLEHLPDPNSTLRGIYNNLTDDSLGIVEVPNFDMIFRNNLFSEFIGDHLLYFTSETLIEALSLNGFEIITCDEVWYKYILSAVVRKKRKLDLSNFQTYQEKLSNEIEAYIQRFGNKSVAIWGAGHQALAVISLTNLAGKIRYVIDSAEFKQGKYTSATHIPIVAPDHLHLDPVSAVIVVSASYSDEVAGILQRNYGGQLEIAILRDYGLQIF